MLKRLSIFCIVGMAFVVMAHAVGGAELPAGTIITKDNLDRIKNDTFEGKTIASMLTGILEWQIRNWRLQIKLRHSEPLPLDPRWIAATKKYAGSAKFDPKTRECTGYMAGTAFPDISPDDPYVGWKVAWNGYYGSASIFGYNHNSGPHAHVLISHTGLERV